jgi:hypothetical protein
MNSFQCDAKALEVWFDEYNMWVLFTDGRQLSIPISYFPRLEKAKKEQLKNYELSGGGIGIHWNELDEDLSVPHLLIGNYAKKSA